MGTLINITPMAMGQTGSNSQGVLGIPISCMREWKTALLENRHIGWPALFIYAGVMSDVTISPKHVDDSSLTASAWQFRVADETQLQQLVRDGNLPLSPGQKYKQLDCTIYPAPKHFQSVIAVIYVSQVV